MINKNMYYSASVNGFFSYGADKNKLPKDVILIAYDDYLALLAEASQPGNTLVPGEDGKPKICEYIPEIIEHELDEIYTARKLLQDTNQYVIDAMELGEAIPTDVKIARENARKILNTAPKK